jgi:membrane protein YdbS with pleckstrin-like domain
MARGRPLLWSCVIGLPYLVIGAALWLFEAVQPGEAGFPVMGFGVIAILVGFYLRSAAEIQAPPLRAGEELLAARHPTQRVARAKFVISVPFLLLGLYLLVETRLPYVYPTIPAAIGLWIYFSAANTYWANTVTTYYLTTERIIKEYRFFSLLREEIPLERIRGVQERKGIIEKFVGLGNIRVASGGSAALEIVIRDIEEATAFAEQIRNNI